MNKFIHTTISQRVNIGARRRILWFVQVSKCAVGRIRIERLFINWFEEKYCPPAIVRIVNWPERSLLVVGFVNHTSNAMCAECFYVKTRKETVSIIFTNMWKYLRMRTMKYWSIQIFCSEYSDCLSRLNEVVWCELNSSEYANAFFGWNCIFPCVHNGHF